MSNETHLPTSRRTFIGHVGQLGVTVAISGCAASPAARARSDVQQSSATARTAWDLSWVNRIEAASDRAVFDAPTIGDGSVLDFATRYLDNCDSVYGRGGHTACVVLNVRTRAVAIALTDDLWDRYALGAQYDVKDPVTKLPATRNPFRELAAGAFPGAGAINDLVNRGAILLVCDFALGHLATRLATKVGRAADQVHTELRAGFIPGAIAVPSGMFGLAKAQNAGCGLVAV